MMIFLEGAKSQDTDEDCVAVLATCCYGLIGLQSLGRCTAPTKALHCNDLKLPTYVAVAAMATEFTCCVVTNL